MINQVKERSCVGFESVATNIGFMRIFVNGICQMPAIATLLENHISIPH